MARHLFTSEAVTEGHPDKSCDQISDAILYEILTHDPNARVACETCSSTGLVHIMGEITTNCYVAVSYTHLDVYKRQEGTVRDQRPAHMVLPLLRRGVRARHKG